jgi:hypothetical protein
MSDSGYSDESFSEESYGDDFENDDVSPPKTFRASQPTEKVVSDLSALDELMASLDNTLEKAKIGAPASGGATNEKREEVEPKNGGEEDGESKKCIPWATAAIMGQLKPFVSPRLLTPLVPLSYNIDGELQICGGYLQRPLHVRPG